MWYKTKTVLHFKIARFVQCAEFKHEKYNNTLSISWCREEYLITYSVLFVGAKS